MAAASFTERIANFVVGASYRDLPAEVIQKAKEQIVFFFGRAFEGASSLEGRQILKFAAQNSQPNDGVTVIGSDIRLLPSDAALANCSLMRGTYGRDDVIWPAGIHAGVITLPTALAIGEMTHASGRELLLALVLGYEVLGKLGNAANSWAVPYPRRPTNVFGGFGPVTVAGRLLGLESAGMANALGYAANLEIGIPEGGMTDHYYGLINRNGAFAAQLAGAGGKPYSKYTIEGPTGLYHSFFGELPRTLDGLIDGLGADWEILKAEQKRHPGTGQNTVPVELLLELIAAESVTANRVATINVLVPFPDDSALRRDAIASRGPFRIPVEAQSSLPYAFALLLLQGRLDLERFADDAADSLVNDKAVAQMMQKVNVSFEADHGPRFAKVEIFTTDGHRYVRELATFAYTFPRSMWGDWLSERGSQILPESQLESLESLVAELESVDDVSRLMATARKT